MWYIVSSHLLIYFIFCLLYELLSLTLALDPHIVDLFCKTKQKKKFITVWSNNNMHSIYNWVERAKTTCFLLGRRGNQLQPLKYKQSYEIKKTSKLINMTELNHAKIYRLLNHVWKESNFPICKCKSFSCFFSDRSVIKSKIVGLS